MLQRPTVPECQQPRQQQKFGDDDKQGEPCLKSIQTEETGTASKPGVHQRAAIPLARRDHAGRNEVRDMPAPGILSPNTLEVIEDAGKAPDDTQQLLQLYCVGIGHQDDVLVSHLHGLGKEIAAAPA
jgi:hypothetical protein